MMNPTHKKGLLSFAFLLLILLILNSGCSNELFYSQQGIKNRYIDLTKHQFNQGYVNFDGEWEFYWNQLLKPNDFKNAALKPDYINVPGSWNKQKTNDKFLTGDGFATYRIEFKTKGNERLGLKMPRIFTAYNLWVNGEVRASAGKVGISREKMTPQYLPQVVLFDSLEGINEVVIQISNYYHRSGGILEGIILGGEKQILDMRYKSIAYELLLFGSLTIMGLYHMFLFFFRTKNSSTLYFGLFCLLVGIRTLFVCERFFLFLFPSFNWEVAHKIQTLTFYLGLPVILTFFMTVFPAYFRCKIVHK